MKTVYTAVAIAHGGRDGLVTSDDGLLRTELRRPEAAGGTGGATNPEQLFAAAYAASFETVLRGIATLLNKPLEDVQVRALVSLNLTDDEKYILKIELRGHAPGLSTEETYALMHAAHAVCPYSNATRDNIDVKIIAEPAGAKVPG
jgi:lipoyl-dependent peroxiredoxin